MGTWVDLPVFRDENGVWQRAITLPDEICGPIGKAVLDELVARGLAAKGPAFQPGDQSDREFLSPRARGAVLARVGTACCALARPRRICGLKKRSRRVVED
jgi:hypothetical protein